MKWYVVVSLCFCAANFVTALALVGLSSYHLYDDDRFVPVKESHDWFEMVVGLIPFAIFVVIVSLFSLWGVIQKNRKWTASVLALNAICVGGCIFFVVMFSEQANGSPISEDILLQHTKASIEKYISENDDVTTWVPGWLDHIQKESSSCCGIQTYKDWIELWPQARSMIPQSCCLIPSNDTITCPKDLARIPYPGTPAKFIKVDHGCVEEINETIKRHILETYKFVGILTLFVIVGEVAYCLLYFLRYYCPSGKYDKNQDKSQKVDVLASVGDGDNIGDESCIGLSKLTLTQVASSSSNNNAMQGELRIDPDTGNPIVSFNVVTFEKNASASVIQSGSSSITSAVLPESKPIGKLQGSRDGSASPELTYNNPKNKTEAPKGDTAMATTADPISTNKKPQRRAVFMVQDTSDYFNDVTMDEIASGLASNSSYDDFGDLPSEEVAQNQTMREKGAGVTRKKRF